MEKFFMPLYMDFHKLDSSDISMEELAKAHDEDLAIQERFGVFELKYWVNVEAKSLFCLVQGPSKEACNEVHRQSHGNAPCNIIEVSEDEFNLYFGIGKSVNDLAHTESGEIDTGYRTLLLFSHDDLSGQNNHYSKEVNRLIEHYKGSRVIYPDDDILVSFIFASNAILCAKAIHKLLLSIPDNIEFNLTLVSGKPVDELGNNMFEESKKKVQYLCALGLKKTMYLDSETKILSDKERMSSKIKTEDFNLVKNEDFVFSFQLFDVLEEKIEQPDFKSEDFNNLLGLSKSQTYRKIKSLTGIAPNQLIQEFRLRKSLKCLKQHSKTISETAYDLGFNSPTYFAKVFRKRFNSTPTHFTKISEGS
jgi:AraC-like DNA-binding protein